jgi:hypothetical protein
VELEPPPEVVLFGEVVSFGVVDVAWGELLAVSGCTTAVLVLGMVTAVCFRWLLYKTITAPTTSKAKSPVSRMFCLKKLVIFDLRVRAMFLFYCASLHVNVNDLTLTL